MTGEKDLILALEFITEGARAVIPRALKRKSFLLESFKAVTEKIRNRSRDWTQGAGIQGIGIGQKLEHGKETKTLAMRVYVERKRPKSKVKNLVPKSVDVPEVGKVYTDVVEIGRVQTEMFTSHVRPAMPGCGVGHPKVTVGTLGCLVRKKGAEQGLYILSNSHVLADEGMATIGDSILQPGVEDRGRKTKDVIAILSEFQPFDFSSDGYPNLIDAAIAKVASESDVIPEIRIVGQKPIGISHTIRRGMKVYKVGRTTDYTIGEVTDIHYRLRIPYKRPPSGRRRMAGLRDQVLCTRYTGPGDSGSVVLNNRHRVVGLHFAGSPSTSIFNRISNVLSLLDIDIVV